jgi:hypothetical protein
MASNADTDHPTIDLPSETEDSTTTIDSPKESPSTENNAKVKESSATPKSPSSEVKNPVEPVGLTLTSPFQSPKIVAEDNCDEPSVEEGQISEDMVGTTAATEDVSGHGQEESTHDNTATQNGTKNPLSTQAYAHCSTGIQGSEKELPVEKDLVPFISEAKHPTAPQAAQSNEAEPIHSPIAKSSLEDSDGNGVETATTEENGTKNDEEAAGKALSISQPARSVPPHLRLDFQPPLPLKYGIHDSRNTMPANENRRFNESLRGTRHNYLPFQPRGDNVDREQLVRMSAQLMKVKNELDAERKKNTQLHSTVQTEERLKAETASTSLLNSLFREQMAALSLKAQVEAKECDLEFREKKIKELEIFLSEGQKQVYYELEQKGVRPMSEVQLERARREAELAVKKSMADIESTFAVKLEGLRLREGAQKVREEQYKALIRDAVETELQRKTLTSDKVEEIAEIEYNNGFAAGKEAARKESHQQGFLEGYGACHQAMVSLTKVRQGLIRRDSPELDFLYDANHVHNMFNMGAKFGRLGLDNTSNQVMTGISHVPRATNTVKKDVSLEKKEILPETKVPEAPVRKAPPPRPTFAAELRGASPMYNGHVVLANHTASPKTNGGRELRAPASAGLEASRKIVRYEESEGEDLIDLM